MGTVFVNFDFSSKESKTCPSGEDRCTKKESSETLVYSCESSSDWKISGLENGCKDLVDGTRFCFCSTDNCEPAEVTSSDGKSSFY